MKISIITVCYNSERTISRTIESVLAQDFADIECLIIDGASSDNTVSIAESYRVRFAEKGVRLAMGYVGDILNSDDSCFMYCEDFDLIHCIHRVAKN